MVAINTARSLVRDLLRKSDRSAYILAEYMPPRAKDLFLGLRAFNLETQKVVDGASDRKIARVRMEFWKASVQDIHADSVPEEPVSALLHHVVHHESLPVSKRYLLTMVQTRESRLQLAPIRTVEDMERFGEGTFSQINYALLDGLHTLWQDTAGYLASNPDVDSEITNIAAHLGQAAGIASLLRTFTFYARKHSYVNLPVDLFTKAGISQQQVLDAADQSSQKLGSVPGLADVAFEVATRANDHVLTARSMVNNLRTSVGVAPSLNLVGMSALPVILYLEQLEKNNFDLARSVGGEWRLPWRSWRAYRTRRF